MDKMQNIVLVIVLVSLFILLIGIIIFLIYRRNMYPLDKEKADEIERIFTYVCTSNESVMEVNLENMTAQVYVIKDNKLCSENISYKTENNFLEFMHPDDYEEVSQRINIEQINELIETGKEIVFEARGKVGDSDYNWYIYTIRGIISSNSHPKNFMLFKRNINNLKLKEEKSKNALMDALNMAKEAGEAKGTFMSRMSHEIRTPLNAVIGYMTLAKDYLTYPQKVEDYITKSQLAAKHLLNIINDILDISAIESGKIKIASEEFDLRELLSSISVIFYSQAKEKEIDFKVDILDITDEIVIGDQLRINQILMNLLSNAIKFTPEGGSIKVTAAQLQSEDEQVRFKFVVADTGIGMTKEFMSRIFNPFEQEKASTAQKFGGSGLGLSITKNLITMMQGSIDVYSEENKGSTFTVYIVFGKCENNKSHGKVRKDFAKLRALIVDDEERTCDYMKSLLKRCHVKSDVVYNGNDAVKQIMKRMGTDYEYDICLIDWNMPGINGVETAKRIRTECHNNVPIIIASAYDTNEIMDDAVKAGVNKVVSKPLFQSTMFDLLVDTYGIYNPELESEINKEKLDLTGIKILLAEDNEMNREIAVDILKKSGLIIDTAVNGQEVCDKFVNSSKDTYQVILMDIQMPIMDGYEAAKHIRNSCHVQAKDIPIVAITANAFTEDVTAALSAGMNDHISKPINYDKLYSILEKYIKLEK